MAPRVIGIAGKKRSGKDTLGALFESKYLYERISFAGALWKILLAADPWIDTDISTGAFYRLSFLNEQFGYEECKTKFPEVRRLMQKLGTEGVREHIGQETWLSIVKNKIIANPDKKFVVCDVRFDNEAWMIQDLGGVVVKLERDGGESDGHVSEEIERIHHDELYENTGSLRALESFAMELVRRY